MTDQEIIAFFEKEKVHGGDTLRFCYSFGIIPKTLQGILYHKEFVFGGRAINTKLGPLNLPQLQNYLLLSNDINGLFAVSSSNISELAVSNRRAINAQEYSQFVIQCRLVKDLS